MELSQVVLRLLVSLAAGLVIGLEREARGHEAGIGTHTLVALGATVFTLAGAVGATEDGGDPWRIAAQVASGIGFIGAGTIIQSRGSIKGLTTAASLWFTAGVGVAAGVGGLALALVAVGGGLFLLTVRELAPVRRLAHKAHHTASVTVLHAERDGLAGVLTPLLVDAHGPVVIQTEASAWPDGRGRWQTTIHLDQHGLAGLVERLQASPATIELTIDGADS